MATAALKRAPLTSKAGPARLVTTRGYGTTMALSTLNKLLGAQILRSGDGVHSIPESRRRERLFGASAAGRTKALSTGVKIEKLGKDYEPREDSCMRAFVRLLAVRAEAAAAAAEAAVEGDEV